jgi:hypothetical protein
VNTPNKQNPKMNKNDLTFTSFLTFNVLAIIKKGKHVLDFFGLIGRKLTLFHLNCVFVKSTKMMGIQWALDLS